MRTVLPSGATATAIANCDPIESPSGLAWDVSRKRWRRRTSSQIRRTAAAAVSTRSLIIVGRTECLVVGFGPCGPFCFQLLKNSFDAVALFDRLVVEERQFRDTLQPKALTDLAAQKRRRPIERTRRLPLRLVVPDRRVIHAGLLQIRRQLDLRDRQKSDAGIVNLSRQQRRKLRLNLIADTRSSRAVNHDRAR